MDVAYSKFGKLNDFPNKVAGFGTTKFQNLRAIIETLFYSDKLTVWCAFLLVWWNQSAWSNQRISVLCSINTQLDSAILQVSILSDQKVKIILMTAYHHKWLFLSVDPNVMADLD